MLIQNQILVLRGFESVNMIETLKWLQKCRYHDTRYCRACTVRIFFKILYVLLTIKPRHGHDLHENGEHDGSSGGEGVQYLKHVHPSLHRDITTGQLYIPHPCIFYEIKSIRNRNLLLDMLLAKRVRDKWWILIWLKYFMYIHIG